MAALLLFAAHAPFAAAQDDGPVARPTVKPGDLWAYRRIDLESGRSMAAFDVRVNFANESIIQSVVIASSGRVEVDQTHTAEWNSIATWDGGNFVPNSGLLKFPLAVGASYVAMFENTIPRRGAFRVKHERKMRVVGWEDVTVPAGTFRALKIVGEGTYQRLDVSASGTVHNVIWYAPQVKRWVKTTYEDRNFGGRGNWTSDELVEYKVQ
ncbi:MAG TPA: hypothetical protein VF943_13390 [Burkholderiales bacterium]